MNKIGRHAAAAARRLARAVSLGCIAAAALTACGGSDDGVTTPPASSAGTHWDVAHASSPAWQSVAYADGSFIAVGLPGGIAQSSDGVSWTRHDSAGSEDWRAAARGNGQWIALGSRGELLASADGATWTTPAPALLGSGADAAESRRDRASGASHPEIDIPESLNALVYGNGVFVAADGGPTFTSTDGTSWTQTSPGFGPTSFGNGRFVAVSSHGVDTSTDGATWSAGGAVPAEFASLSFVGSVFVGLGNTTDEAYVSSDGAAWTSAPLPCAPDPGCALLGSTGAALYVSAADRLYASTDGVAWNAAATNADLSHARSLAGGAGTVVLVSSDGRIQSGPDLAHLATTAPASIGELVGVDVVGGSALAVSDDGLVFASAGGAAWTQTGTLGAAPGTFFPRSIAHAPDGTIIVGGFGYTTGPIAFARSTDGHAWTLGLSAAAGIPLKSVQAAVHDGTRFVAIDGNCDVLTSPTGEQWTQAATVCDYVTTPTTAIGYGNGRYVIVGGNGFAATSTDAVHWTTAPPLMTPGDTGTPMILTGLAFDGTRFVASAADGHALVGTDGLDWTVSATATATALTAVAALPGGPFVAVGVGGVAQSSVDGVHWTLRTTPASPVLHAIAAGNGGFVTVGERGLIETSTH